MLETVYSETAGEPLQALVGGESVKLTEIQRSILWLLFPSREELKSIRKTKEEASDPERGHSMHNATPEKPFPQAPVCHCVETTVFPRLSSDTREEGPAPHLPTSQLLKAS